MHTHSYPHTQQIVVVVSRKMTKIVGLEAGSRPGNWFIFTVALTVARPSHHPTHSESTRSSASNK